MQSKKEESGNVANSYPDAPLYMAISVPTLEFNIGIENPQKVEAVRDLLIKNNFKFIESEQENDKDFTWLKFEKITFSSFDVKCIDEVMNGEFYSFTIFINF